MERGIVPGSYVPSLAETIAIQARRRASQLLKAHGEPGRNGIGRHEMPESDKLIPVTFRKSRRKWHAGDRAGFPKDVIDRLARAGVVDPPSLLEKVAGALKPKKAARSPDEEPPGGLERELPKRPPEERAYEEAIATGASEEEALQAAESAAEPPEKKRRRRL